MLRRKDDATFTPSPLRGEGRGEGRLLRKTFIEASFDGCSRKIGPLTSILSPEGRGSECKERFLV